MKWQNEHMAGLLPLFLSEDSPADAVTQLDRAYTHGGGWHDFDGFNLVREGVGYALEYPGDPLMREVARVYLRKELIVLFQFSWVAVIQPDETFRVARMD